MSHSTSYDNLRKIKFIQFIELPELHLDIHHLLYLGIKYIKHNKSSKFLPYLETHWSSTIQNLFWLAYDKMEFISNNTKLNLSAPGFQAIDPIELYHVYVVLLLYFKENFHIDMDQYLYTRWNGAFRHYFWEVYYELVNITFNSHILLFKNQKFNIFTRLTHNFILFVILDYLISNSESTSQNVQDMQFVTYLNTNVDTKTKNRFDKTYFNLKNYIVKHFSKFDDQNDKDLEFINKM